MHAQRESKKSRNALSSGGEINLFVVVYPSAGLLEREYLSSWSLIDKTRLPTAKVFRFEPSRLELLANGESTDGIWDRFEWTRDADGTWSEPRRLMPY